jgi:hypothetical protein
VVGPVRLGFFPSARGVWRRLRVGWHYADSVEKLDKRRSIPATKDLNYAGAMTPPGTAVMNPRTRNQSRSMDTSILVLVRLIFPICRSSIYRALRMLVRRTAGGVSENVSLNR